MLRYRLGSVLNWLTIFPLRGMITAVDLVLFVVWRGMPPKQIHHSAWIDQPGLIGEKQMFIVQLKFSNNRGQASQLMDGHKAWLKQGFDDGIFLLAGTLQPNLGGGIVAHNTTMSALQSRVNDDPFVAEDVVSAEIIEITPSKTDERLAFLLD